MNPWKFKPLAQVTVSGFEPGRSASQAYALIFTSVRKREPRKHWTKAVPSRGNWSVEARRRERRPKWFRAGHVKKLGTARSLRALLELVLRSRICKFCPFWTIIGQEPHASKTVTSTLFSQASWRGQTRTDF